MAKVVKTSGKPRAKLLNGAADGVPFTKDNQPSPEAKSKGWKELRAERLLTQMILAKMAEGNNLKEYVQSLISNAKKGNPKAIDTINNGIEDTVTKMELTGKDGLPLSIILNPAPGCEPMKPDNELL